MSIIAVQLFAIMLVWYLPVNRIEDKPFVVNERQIDTVIELIEPTRHGRLVPAPPRPSALPPVPQDVILEDEIITIATPERNEIGEPEAVSEIPGIPVENPTNPATVVRIVEAITPDEIKRENIRLEVAVRFLVSSEGDVDEIDIVGVKKYRGTQNLYEEIGMDDYEIAGAIQRAAMQWRFRPARHDGMDVRSYSTHIFTLGL
jgi:periplasmic protein TonB